MGIIAVKWHPEEPDSRWFAGLWFILSWAIAGGVDWRATGSVLLQGMLRALAGVVAISGLVWPMLIRPVFVGMTIAVFPIGFTISHGLRAGGHYRPFTPPLPFHAARTGNADA